MGGMSFLPQEFPGAKEGSCFLFPADYTAPLIIYLGKVTVGLDISLIEITKQRFGGRSDTHSLLERIESAVCYPGNLRCKPLYVILFLFKKTFGDEHRHIDIFYARCLKSLVQLSLDIFPDRISCGLDYHAALHIGIVNQFCLLHHIRIPLCKVLTHGCDCFH